MATRLAIRVEDVNGDAVADAQVVVTDTDGANQIQLTGAAETDVHGRGQVLVFNLGSSRQFSVELKPGSNFFGYTLKLTHDPGSSGLTIDARSPVWDMVTIEAGGGATAMIAQLRLVARRIRRAPTAMPPVAPASSQDIAPPVVDDPGGIWLDGSRRIVGLFDAKVAGFPAVVGRDILGDPDADNWGRFTATTSDIDTQETGRGINFDWVEYGDPSGFRLLIALWSVNGAGGRADGKIDLHFFFCPRTDIPFYSPANVYPYKRKRAGTIIVQPYSNLAHRYLSVGGSPGADLGIAYQGMASAKSHVVVMPINAYGFFGPLMSRQGLLRLAREIAAYVSDHTLNLPPPASAWGTRARQLVNRIAVSGYSAGAPDAVRLFTCASIADLADHFGRIKTDVQAQDFAKRLGAFKGPLWQSPLAEFDRKWTEYYSVDGFFGSDSHQAFPAEFAKWFAGDPERILRVYATTGRMKSPADVVANKLAEVFKGVTPKKAARASDPSFQAEEWHRSDGRATLAWFSESYMKFSSVPFMPTQDAHHTIPRVVVSHALSQSKLLSR
jgi:hypothetical protein